MREEADWSVPADAAALVELAAEALAQRQQLDFNCHNYDAELCTLVDKFVVSRFCRTSSVARDPA